MLINTEGDTSKLLVTTVAPSGLGVGSPIEANAITANPKAAISIPMPIFRGAEGSFPRLAKAPNTARDTGVRATTKKGLNCWNIWGRTSINEPGCNAMYL